jgi:hypothetical protein
MQLILSLFLHHHSHGRNLRLCDRLGLTQVVAQTVAQIVAKTVAQVILPVGIVFIVVGITLVIYFIFLRHGDISSENRGNCAKRRS